MKLPILKVNPSGIGRSIISRSKGALGLVRSKLPALFARTSSDQDAPVPEDPYADVPAADMPQHLRPGFFKRNIHLLPVWAGYGAFGLFLVGIISYAALTNDAAREEQAARIPSVTVSMFAVADADAGANASEPMDIPITEQLAALRAAEDALNAQNSEGEAANSIGADSAQTREMDRFAGNLAPYPDPGLVEEIDAIGLLPRIGDDGRLPWKVYARPSSSLETRARVSVVVLNLGLSVRMTEAAIAMPGSVTLAFSPYAPRLEEWIQQARDAGHEVMIGLPMEPSDFPRSDAGLLSLMATADREQNILNLHRVLSETSGYIGVVNQLGSRFTADRAAVQPIIQAIGERGLVYLDTMANAASIAPDEAVKAGTSHASADLTIDSTQARGVVLTRLSQLELLAQTKRSAVIAVEPYPMLLDQVQDWVTVLDQKNMVLTPLSGVIAARERDARQAQQGSNG